MDGIKAALITAGALIMVYDIIRYILFLRNTQDVFSSEKKTDKALMASGLVLLVFFLVGYLFVGFASKPDLLVAFILFFGSVFVTTVLFIMFKLLDSVKEKSLDIAKILISIIDERDSNLNGHSLHVQNLTMLLYKYMPKHLKKQVNPISLEFASLMHDVGKLGIPETILNKPAKLTDEEWEIMRRHPKIGVRFLEHIPSFESVNDWICYHHERIDGKGYYSIEEKQIPLAAKMISVADTYSAITMRRSYKSSKPHEEAMQIIKSVAGTQLDRQLVDIFLTIPEEEFKKCIPDEFD